MRTCKQKQQGKIEGTVYVLGDNIDTDQILPANYLGLSLVDSPERKMLGRAALSGVPLRLAGLPLGGIPFIPSGMIHSPFNIIIAGENFGCGSSREHAIVALSEAGVVAVLARSYARIFFRNAIATGAIVPFEFSDNLITSIRTWDKVILDFNVHCLQPCGPGGCFQLNLSKEAGLILSCGGLFGYARTHGMLPNNPNAPALLGGAGGVKND